MKFIHCADIHADSKMDAHFTKEQAALRRSEIAASFANMVSFAKSHSVRAIVIAGDLFDTKETQQKIVKRQIGDVISQNPDIDFLYLRGNHDADVAFLQKENPPNLKRFSKSAWTKYSYENVDVFGREFGDKIPASAYSELSLNPARVNVVVLHGQIAEYKAKDGAPVISLPHLQNKNIDYLALGHIHSYKKAALDGRGVWCYSGCLAGRGFDECGEKGFALLAIKNGKVESRFVPVAQRTVREVAVALDGAAGFNDIMAAIRKSVSGVPESDIVQVNLVGEISEETPIETDSYQTLLAPRYFFICVKDKTALKIDYEKYEKDVSLKGEFIRLVKSQSGISDEGKAKIIMAGINALRGERL